MVLTSHHSIILPLNGFSKDVNAAVSCDAGARMHATASPSDEN